MHTWSTPSGLASQHRGIVATAEVPGRAATAVPTAPLPRARSELPSAQRDTPTNRGDTFPTPAIFKRKMPPKQKTPVLEEMRIGQGRGGGKVTAGEHI